MESAVLLAVAVFLLFVVLVLLYLSVRIVNQYEQLVVFRLGRTNVAMVRGPSSFRTRSARVGGLSPP